MNRRSGLRRRALLGVAVAVLALVTACGSSNTTNTTPVTTFTPVSPNPAPGTVAMLAGGSVGATTTIRIVVTDVNSFFGAAFRVTYDPTTLRCNGIDTATSFLSTGVASTDVYFSADFTTQPGVAVIAASRLDPTKVPPVDVAGTQDLLTISFTARKTIPPSGTTGVLAFGDPKQVCDGTVVAPGCGAVTINAWDGGTIVSQIPQ